ncbi:hypothetical protein [Actinocrinis sp.]|uniref:hypothetical protein n=1 Tax=Actinocrinis sp. TaxID=1920516 RepID=UPI002D3468EF|nr:hypothetical protein [Actinocrinis sp.]HZP49593.1 hypothetical protein [Actinocrinis sp.]
MTAEDDRTRGWQAPNVPVNRFRLDAKKRGKYFACAKFADCASEPIPRGEYNPAQPPNCATHHEPMTVHVEPAQ